jgi:hypothetical protein
MNVICVNTQYSGNHSTKTWKCTKDASLHSFTKRSGTLEEAMSIANSATISTSTICWTLWRVGEELGANNGAAKGNAEDETDGAALGDAKGIKDWAPAWRHGRKLHRWNTQRH